MKFVIQIEWLGGVKGLGVDDGNAGRYVSRYDPDAHGGRGHIGTVASAKDALSFPTAGEAIEFCRQVSKMHPVRDDGKPNRPLTAYTVTIKPWEDEAVEK